MPVRYIGRTTYNRGKTLFELLCNLKDFGVGRIVVRSIFERYPEPSYFIIRIVKPEMDPALLKGEVWTEQVFRGVRYPGLQKITWGYKDDWRLIPKNEVNDYTKNTTSDVNIRNIPRYAPLPPLLSIIVKEQWAKEGRLIDKEPMVERIINDSLPNNRARLTE